MNQRALPWLVAVGLAAGLLTGTAAGAADAAPDSARPRSPISMTADALSIDTATRVVIATGNVRITAGAMTATAGRATIQHGKGLAELTDRPRVSGPQGILQGTGIGIEFSPREIRYVVARGGATLEAKEGALSALVIIIDPRSGATTGQGEVLLRVPPDIVATGAEVFYDRRQGFAFLAGNARVQGRDGFVQGHRIEARERGRRATVTGPVTGRFRDIEVRSRTAEIFGAEKKAVFEGDVSVRQPGRQMTTEKATVWYEARRVVAEGQTRVQLEGQP